MDLSSDTVGMLASYGPIVVMVVIFYFLLYRPQKKEQNRRKSMLEALKKGKNSIEIKVTNTWANRLIGDEKLLKEERLTWTTAPFRLGGEPLLKAGLLGPVTIVKEK